MRKHLLIMAAPLALAACGSSHDPEATVSPGFRYVAANSTVDLKGVSMTTNYTGDGAGKATSVGDFNTDTDAGVELAYDGDKHLTVLSVEAGGTTQTWDTEKGDLIADIGGGLIGASNPSGTKAALLGDPKQLGFNYQSFGIWQTGDLKSGSFGAVSAGWETDPTTITDATATFTGKSGGVYADAAGNSNFTTSDVTVGWDGYDASLTTSNTKLVDVSGSVIANAPSLDLNAPDLTVAKDASISGSVTNAGGNMSGTVAGQFYGVNAPEVGGVFGLKGAGVESYGGAFGAKQ